MSLTTARLIPSRPAFPILIVVAAVIALAQAPLPLAAQSRGAKSYPEPTPDLALPVGTPNPPFLGELPAEPLLVQRTGTYGGNLIYSVLGEIDTFNPVEPTGATSQELRSMIFSSLVGYDLGRWEPVPLLATRWDVSEDHKSWTFHLRKGVRWSDGEPVTIDDVEFSFRAIFHPQVPSSIRDGFLDEQGRHPSYVIDQKGQSITFTTHEIDSQFLTHVGNVSIIPKHKWKDHLQDEGPTILQQMTNATDPREIVGCGPFVLKRYWPAEKIEYERNPYYFKVDARGQRLPYFDRATVVIIKDQNLQVEKFLAGEHHLMNDLPPDRFKQTDEASKGPDARFEVLRMGVSLNTHWIVFNLHPGKKDDGTPFVPVEKQHWFQNLEFRRAVNHAVDREGLVKAALDGRGQAIYASITPGNRLFFCKSVPVIEHSPAKAGEILDGLGWTDRDGDGVREDDLGRPLRFTLNTNVENNMRQQMGPLIMDDLRQVGIDIDFRPVDFNGLVTRLRDSHEWDMILMGWGSGVPPDPSNSKNILRSSGRLHAWYPGQPSPATPWEKRVDELIGMMDRELDTAKRKEYSDEIQMLDASNQCIIYLVAQNSYALSRKDVGNLWPSLLRPQTTWNVEELYQRTGAGVSQ